MKALTFSRLCLIGALILGLWAALSAGTPQTLIGSSISGSECPSGNCNWTGYGTCDDKPDNPPGKQCSNQYYSCDGEGSGQCGGETTFCPSSTYCQPYDGGFCRFEP